MLPQDVMYEELTVEENIFFSSMLFSRKDAWARLPDTRLLVNDVISILGLHKVRNSVIGNAEVRGVSGEERQARGGGGGREGARPLMVVFLVVWGWWPMTTRRSAQASERGHGAGQGTAHPIPR